MEMKRNDSDRHIKHTIIRHETPVDADALWDAIEPKLRKRRRRGFIWFWWGLGGICLGLVCLFIFQNEKTLDVQLIEKTKDAPQQNPSLSIKKDVLNQGNIKEFQPHPERKTAVDSIRETSIWQNHLDDYDQLTRTNPSAQDETIQSKWALPKLSMPFQPGIHRIPPENELSGYTAVHPPILLPKLRKPVGLLDLPPRTINLNTSPKPDRRHLRIELGIKSGLYQIKRNLIPRDSALHLAYLQQRQVSETTLEAVSLAFELNAKHHNGMYFQLGLQGTRINERLLYELQVESARVDSNGIQEIRIDPEGDTTFIYGPVNIKETTRFYRRHFNHYDLLDIPLGMGYEFNGYPWSIGIEGGILLNLRLRSKGLITSMEDLFTTLENGDVMKTNIGLGYRFSLLTNYHINKKLAISGGVAFQSYPGSFTQDQHPIIQRYSLLGGQIGLKYRLK